MKIVHLSAGDLNSGAGQGARWLHRALLRKGVDSELHSSRPPGGDCKQEYLAAGGRKLELQLLSRIDRWPLQMRQISPTRNFSTGFAGINLKGLVNQTRADLLHLHYINTGFIGLGALKSVEVPIVWTFRDMWPFTGGCHYSWDCDRYEMSCGVCPILNSDSSHDLSHRIWSRKQKIYTELKDFYPVAISPWLKNCAEKSSVLSGRKIEMIWNGVDLDNFKPIKRTEARARLELPSDRPILLLGANRASSILKGYDKLLAELGKLRESEKFEVVRFGHIAGKSSNEAWVKDLGYVIDRKRLNDIYAAADVFLAPSPQEAFGKTVVESLASGTPVVVFSGSGSAEIIDSGVGGEVVPLGDFENFSKIGVGLAQQTANAQAVREESVKRSLQFSDQKCAESYQNLYKKILAKQYEFI